jgi:hypothetical protein
MLLATLLASALGACDPAILPTIDMFRATNGKPDHHEVKTCGGGQDEFGNRIKPWKCLIWRYDGKGFMYFSAEPEVAQVHYHVTGCRSGHPTIRKDDGYTWQLVRCMSPSPMKEKGCVELGLGADYDDDYAPAPPLEDDEGNPNVRALQAWMTTQPQTCTTYADAQKAVKACLAAIRDTPTQASPEPDATPSSARQRTGFGEKPPEGTKL